MDVGAFPCVCDFLYCVNQTHLRPTSLAHIQADLRRADFAAKQRAMEDAFMALEVLSSDNTYISALFSRSKTAAHTFPDLFLDLQLVKNIHDRMVRKMYRL